MSKEPFNRIFKNCDIKHLTVNINSGNRYTGPDMPRTRNRKYNWTRQYVLTYLMHQVGKNIDVKRAWVNGTLPSGFRWEEMAERYGFSFHYVSEDAEFYTYRITGLTRQSWW